MKPFPIRWLALAILLAFFAVALGSTAALARTNNTITVNSTDGTWNPGDGKCTLREAINNANNDSNLPPGSSPDCAAGNGADVIVLELGSTFALSQVDSGAAPDTNGMPVITSEITINGAFSGITRNSDAPNFRIFKVNASGKLTLNDLVIGGGQLKWDGGGIYNAGTLILNNTYLGDNTLLQPDSARKGFNGGGIYNTGQLTLNRASIYHNTSGQGGVFYDFSFNTGYQGGHGGGIYNAAGASTEILNQTRFSLNQTGIGGRGGNPAVNVASGSGGGIYNEGVVHITQSYLLNNQTGLESCFCPGFGGNIAQGSGELTISDSQVSRGSAYFGGGLYVRKGNVQVVRTLLEHNRGVDGATLNTFNEEGSETATVYLWNSTIADSAADWKPTETLFSRSIISSAASVTLNYSTITNNTVPTLPKSAGLVTRVNSAKPNLSTILVLNSIVANTTSAPNCYQEGGNVIQNGGNNIDSGASCGFGSTNGSVSNTDPKLSALADNGGYSWTMAIASDSPARDQGDTTACLYANTINNIDQRGFPRIKGTNNSCDIGAYEYGASAPVVEPTVTNTPTVTPTNVPPGPTSTPTVTPTDGPPGPTSIPTLTPTSVPPPTNTPNPCPEAPFAAKLTAPANNTTVTAARVQLKWNPAVCATTYNVVVKLKNKVVDSANDLTTTKFKTKALAAGKTYTWLVQACNPNGCTNSMQFKFIK